jgi:stage V sporulation protein R
MSNKFMYGSPILLGSSTTPGVQIPPELKKVIPDILKSCTDFGLDYYPPIIQMLTHDEMSEVASYGGFGVRYPHWKWGMEYEEMQRGYMHGMHKIYEMVVNCCFSATRILTKRGTIQADQVVKGDYVIGQKGWRKVAAVVRQKKSELRKIELKNQFRSLICTSNHKWLVAKKDGFQWVESENIVVGDLIVGCDTSDNFKGSPASFNIDESRAYTSTPKNLHHCIKKIKIPNQMTEELAELIGVILGDGSIGVKSAENNIVVAVGKKHKDYAEHVANLFFSVFGQEAKVYEKPNCFAVTFCSKSAVDFFDQIDLPKGCTFKNKRIPQVIFSSSHEYRVALLRGLFDTDGYCGKSGIRYSSKSKRLIEEIQLILSELGIYTAARHVVNNHNDIYTLEISGRIAAAKFAAVISLRQRYKQESLIKNASKAKCSAGGVKVEFLQQQLVEISKNIKSYSFPKIYYSRKLLTQKNVGLNTLCAFIENMEQHKFEVPESLKKYVNTPYYEVTQNSVYGIDESIDIALHHEDHDFVAEGFMSHNTNPCYIYCLNSNTLLDNVTVIAHALGHSHFFKNNLFFQHTNKNMLNEFANHGTRIRRYMSRWGKERVIEFIDHVLRVETLVDNAKAWNTRQVKEPIIRDHRKYRQPRRMQTDKSRMYMDDWINTKDFVDAEHKRIEKADKADELGLMLKPEKDIFGWIRENANLKPWQSDIMAMLYEEAMYYAPQGMTKCCNEAFASWIDYKLIAEQGLCALGQEAHDHGIVEYSKHKMGVLGGKYSTNPYKLGFSFLMDIEERWNKGMFGNEWEDVSSYKEKENWDKKLGLGKDKVFEIVRLYDDVNLINEFFTQDFCDKYQFFDWQKQENGEYVVQSKDANVIKRKLIEKYSNRGLPTINLVDNNHLGKGIMLLEHVWNGRTLYIPYVNETLGSINFLTGRPVLLASKNKNGEEIVFYCEGFGDSQVHQLTRLQYKREFGISV